jgi:ADP-ribosylglycohydrolase
MEDNYKSFFLLHALGDIIGGKVEEWIEKNIHGSYLDYNVNEFTSRFISLGGVNNIDINNWLTSSNPLYQNGIVKSLLIYNNKFDDDFYLNVKNNLITVHNNLVKEEKEENIIRIIDSTTETSIENFSKDKDERHKHSKKGSCNIQPCTRSLCIGIAFFNDKDKLIESSINICKMTHNNIISCLCGLTTAFFASLAINKVPIETWVFKLIELLESLNVKKYINEKDKYENDNYNIYIKQWKNYLKRRFMNGVPINKKIFKNLDYRFSYHLSNFYKRGQEMSIIGLIILAYDSLILCNGLWEPLIFYNMTLIEEVECIGAISSGLYGLVYGTSNIPVNMMKNIENKDTFEKIGIDMYKRFFLSTDTKMEKKINKLEK